MLPITLSKVFSQINHKEIGILKNRQSVLTLTHSLALTYFPDNADKEGLDRRMNYEL